MKKHHGIIMNDLVRWSGAEACLSAARLRQPVGRIWMDSRKVQKSDVFAALTGETGVDGHAFVAAALKQGAGAAIVARRALRKFDFGKQPNLIVTADPLKALHRMAARYRAELNIPLIAVTGSNGKTTTRAFISAVLGSSYVIGATDGNWNNHIGVPLSILRFDGRVRIGVLEFGANHQGEISLLSKTARPDIAVITNIGYAHVGNFGSLSATTSAKFEIADGLDKHQGFLLLNGDDPRLVAESRRRDAPTAFFGMSPRCHARAQNIRVDRDGASCFTVDNEEYRLAMPGRHFIYNALPAIFLGRWFGLQPGQIAAALATVAPESLRGQVCVKGGVRFIVDCYNANPSSMRSAIGLLADIGPAKKLKAIVGDMRELGRFTLPQHRTLGRLLVDTGVSAIIAVGENGQAVKDGAVKAGMKASAIVHAPDAASALTLARKILKPGDTVLLKGSRAVGLEQVFERW
jgi:UDP-N-acetylmuramoyl-tripeptide--D-alanyl-D-alanine ligase